MIRWGLAIVALAGCGADPAMPGDGGADVPRLPVAQRDITRQSATMARSHEMGTNCAQCHSAEGSASGFFTTSGSVRRMDDQPFPGVTVELRNAPMGRGDLLASAVTDQTGNFYTTRPIGGAPTAMFVSLVSPSGARRNMPFPTLSGQCNFCHVGRQRFRMTE